MTTQQEIIQNIRRENFLIGVEINKEVSKGLEKIKADLASSLIQLSEDLYAKETHFVLELIQNADDNSYNEQVSPLLKIIIDSEKILIQNNEVGFEKENINALCAVGHSTKTKELGYIGEKGIGFKSVFRITDEPQIFSNGFQFKFKRKDEEYEFGYIVPYWIEFPPKFIDKKLTNIILPLREDAKEHLLKLKEIEPELLLFLRKLSTIQIFNTNENLTNIYNKTSQNGVVKIESTEGKKHYKLCSEILSVPSEIIEEKRKVKETELILAFPLNPNGTAQTNSGQKVFAFLPTRSYGFKFIIQADFLVPSSREDIHKDKKWNKWLRDSIAPLFIKAIEEFKSDESLKTTFYDYIPIDGEITDSFFSVTVKQLYDALSETECILTESLKWLKPSHVFSAPTGIRALISNEDLKAFFGKEYISKTLEKGIREGVLETLRIPIFDLDNLIECLKNTEWLKKQPDQWFALLYTFLQSSSLKKEQIDSIKKLEIIKLANNELVAANNKETFLPLGKRRSYVFEKQIPFMKKKVISLIDKESLDKVIKFFESLGISKAQPYEIIENYILKDFENGNENGWKSRTTEVLLDYIHYIKDNLNDYERESHRRLNKGGFVTQTDPLQRLKKGIWIRNKSEGNWYSKPENLYLSKRYSNNDNLEFLFSGIERIWFVHSQYITSSRQNIRATSLIAKEGKKKLKERLSAAVGEWMQFLIKLGVENKPRIEKKQYVKTLPPRGSYRTHDIIEYHSQNICSIIQQFSEERNRVLLKILDSNWKYYSNYTHWNDYDFYYSWNCTRIKSDWFEKITGSDWLPSTEKKLKKSSSLFIKKPEIVEFLGDSVPYLNAEIENQNLIAALSINLTVSVENVIFLIKGLVKEGCTDKAKFQKFYSYLNEKLLGNEETIRDSFEEHKLIFIPETPYRYITSEKVFWKNVSSIFGQSRDYLENYYPTLKKFFVNKIGVNEKPAPEDYAEILIEMSKKGSLSISEKDQKNILTIYKELDNSLNPENDELISDEYWWDGFIEDRIFWTNKNQFLNKEKDIFVNDDEELYSLFEEKDSIAFLKLPVNYRHKIPYFLKSADIPLISEAISARLATSVEALLDENLTQLVQKLYIYMIRYLYQQANKWYGIFKEDGRLLKFKQLKCYGVLNLDVEYMLQNESVVKDQIIYLDGTNLFVNMDHLKNFGRIAIELSKFFDCIKGFSDFIDVLFLHGSEDRIENALKVRKIEDLPIEEKQWIESISVSEVPDDSVRYIENSGVKTDEKQPVQETNVNTEASEKGKRDKISDDNDRKINPQGNSVKLVEQKLEKYGAQAVTSSAISPPTKTASLQKSSSNGATSGKPAKTDNGNGNETEWKPICKPGEAKVYLSELVIPDIKSFLSNLAERSQSNLTVSGPLDNDSSTSGNDGNDETNGDLSKDTLSPKVKKEIGKWGEEYIALTYLKDEFTNKYLNSSFEETTTGFNILLNDERIVTVNWLNKETDIAIGYDIEVIERGKKLFIEVKSTKTDSKEIFILSGTQWQFAKEQQDNYFIYRVYNAGTHEPNVDKYCNPDKLWKEDRIKAHSISIKI